MPQFNELPSTTAAQVESLLERVQSLEAIAAAQQSILNTHQTVLTTHQARLDIVEDRKIPEAIRDHEHRFMMWDAWLG